MANKKHIAVGISGGVDSAVSAWLLKQQGHQVSGIFMNNWRSTPGDACQASDDFAAASAVCEHLNIPLTHVDYADEYWKHVFSHCLDEFSANRTPNPDVLCNKYIKFPSLIKEAEKIGATHIATGHYADVRSEQQRYSLHRAQDLTKDQSYFLYLLTQEHLSKSIFPLAKTNKKDTRAIAEKLKLPNYQRPDSTGICFIGEQKFKPFLQEYLLTKPGPIKDTENQIVGIHDGLMFYTIGQRKGLRIGGVKNAEQQPWFVYAKNSPENTLHVCQGKENHLLWDKELTFNQLHWHGVSQPTNSLRCQAQIRHLQPAQNCTLTLDPKNKNHHVQFDQPQWAIAAGQSVVLYHADQCLGGGIINTKQNVT